MESKDIINVLECCIKLSHLGECFENKCPLVSEKGCKVGKETLYPYALELIKRLEAEIERLQDAYKQCAWERDVFEKQLETDKTEAYKEFVDMLKEKKQWAKNVFDYTINQVVGVEDIDKTFKELTERKED